MESRILLMGTDRRYSFAEKDSESKTLVPSQRKIHAANVVPYGLDFDFGNFLDCMSFGIVGYGHPENSGLSREEVAIRNLNLTTGGLDKIMKERGADFVLVDSLVSRDAGTYWRIAGRAQLLVNAQRE
ncbi:MAG: hypothetical protein KJ879_02270 [Nanoarchaeota archaeon]|nr:hypothetical protein [Nanoarchaeota archaeon]